MNARSLQSLEDVFGGRVQPERLFQPRHAAVVVDMGEIRRQPLARCRRLEDELGAFMHDPIGRSEHARAPRLQEEFQHHADEPVRQIAQDFRQAILDDPEAVRHAPFQRGEIGLLPRGTGADHIRNNTASPTAGIDPAALLDTRPVVRALHHHILNSRDLDVVAGSISLPGAFTREAWE